MHNNNKTLKNMFFPKNKKKRATHEQVKKNKIKTPYLTFI